MRHRLLLAAGCGLIVVHPLSAQGSRIAPTDSTLLGRLDAVIETAVVQGDTAALDTLYASDFSFTHSTGDIDDRAAWLRRVAARPRPFRSRTIDSVVVEVHGSVALTSGRLTVVPGDESGYVVRYVRLYLKRNGRWELTSHRSVELRAQRSSAR
jgi:uncharacterized protein DUF4440